MTEKEAINYIENHSWSKTRLGLERSRQLLDMLGNPQDSLRFVHVAGSNGKGSTCAMLAEILIKAGYRTGFYSSPYLQVFNERIRINGQNIPGDALARMVSRVAEAAEQMEDHPSQFELITAAGFLYFAEEKCDVVVLEVGMGGEFDATNVIERPEAAVITNIGLEHTEYLGGTLTEIARAKGGIIKGGDVVCYDGDPEAINEIKRICRERGARLTVADFSRLHTVSDDLPRLLSGEIKSLPIYRRFLYKDEEYKIRLLGKHQLFNAAVAIETARLLSGAFPRVTPETIKAGLAGTVWPGRFEILDTDPLFILDGGHNPQCASALSEALADAAPGAKFLFLLGVLADKDYGKIIDIIQDRATGFVCLTPDNERALKGTELAAYLNGRGLKAAACGSLSKGIDLAFDIMRKESDKTGAPAGIIAFGSLYLAGIVRTEMQRRGKI
ncbi:MAG: bifunctional folylpolyglutamate synthase/dihydrofolate synthase [Lachnospiraceae bacterium]|nr:bifunctional folylpolyglutamate synthase/dihydrofolate synthase [Lachnospiraceae bacterium]